MRRRKRRRTTTTTWGRKRRKTMRRRYHQFQPHIANKHRYKRCILLFLPNMLRICSLLIIGPF